jgi:hypothetical protein
MSLRKYVLRKPQPDVFVAIGPGIVEKEQGTAL